MGTRPVGNTVISLSVTGYHQDVPRFGWVHGDRYRFGTWSPDSQRRQVPIAIDLQDGRWGGETVGKLHQYGVLGISHNMPIGDHKAVIRADRDQRSSALENCSGVQGKNAGHGGMGRRWCAC
ncbi:MAG TPA: hypothetical protein PLD05_04440 [Thermogutta sp.]|nr:hypothetical protein [Thermogutta sp.]